MKQYGALGFISGLLKFFGWLTIIVAVIVLLIGLFGMASTPYASAGAGAGVLILALVSFAVLVSGILLIACGELIDAVVDIAQNTAHLPTIARDSERTVNFFDHMSGKANGRKPDVQPSTR